MDKRNAVLACIEQDKRLLSRPASAIVTAVKKNFKMDVAENYASTLRKEYRDNMNNEVATPVLPVAPEATPEAAAPEVAPAAAAPEAVVIDFRSVDATLDLMNDLHGIAARCGGIENMIVLAQKMAKMVK